MINSYFDLKPLTIAQLMDKGDHAFELPLMRNVGRQIMVLDEEDHVLLHHEYPVYPGATGLFNGNPHWQNKIFNLIEGLLKEQKKPAAIYFRGLRNEFNLIQNRTKQLSKTYHLDNDIKCYYVAPDLEELRIKCQLSLSQLKLNTLQDLIDDLD